MVAIMKSLIQQVIPADVYLRQKHAQVNAAELKR